MKSMKHFAWTLLAVCILLVGTNVHQASAQNLTVKYTLKDGTATKVTEKNSLHEALAAAPMGQISELEISAGKFNKADWLWLKNNRNSLYELLSFSITSSVDVADIPNTDEKAHSTFKCNIISVLNKKPQMGFCS